MNIIEWKKLFPENWSAAIFVSYMILFVNQGILVRWSQGKGSTYEYNTVTVVLLTEVLKLVVSISIYCLGNDVKNMFVEMVKYKKVFLLYMIPSFLYCLYNNLAFVNLAVFDPTTYYLLLQFRVVITGIVFQMVFKKTLSTRQWISLILLTVGCMVKQFNVNFQVSTIVPALEFNVNTFFIFIQTLCSCLAGVYNEYLLKAQGANINILLQNAFMYTDSVICNLAVLTAQGDILQSFDNVGPSIFSRPEVVLIMINNAAIGIVTSFFLRHLNSILKTFASALELVFTAVLCWIIFGIPLDANTIIAIAIVSYSIVLYSQSPVQNVQQNSAVELDIQSEDRKVLV
ncbi:UDP-galactose transporter senju [Orussus abietinus]|uniref:UDP-galactose transporter senju n=1 Tax=Orussus abietinus TaxID=222816 RepID=UPI00062558B0|nr:UDP-galactose transporter senju [Orussus abietinus]